MNKKLKGICLSCFGCNKLENPKFEGEYSCTNYIKANNDNQMMIVEVKENKKYDKKSFINIRNNYKYRGT